MLTSKQYLVIGVAFLILAGGLLIFGYVGFLENYAFASRFREMSWLVLLFLIVLGYGFLARSGHWPRARKPKS